MRGRQAQRSKRLRRGVWRERTLKRAMQQRKPTYKHKCYGNLIAPTNWNSAQSAWCINMATSAGHYVEYGNNWFTGGGGTAAWFGTHYSGTYHFDQGTNKGGVICMPCMDLGDSLRRRGPARSWFGISPSGPFNIAAMTAGTNGPSTDMFGTPRKVTSGGTTFGLMGPVEPSNRGVKETTTVNTGTASMKIVGCGSHSFQYPVDSGSSTITIYARYDATYTGSNLPRISIRDGAEAGVADQDVTMTSGSDTWQQLNVSLSASAKGDDHGHPDGAQRRGGGQHLLRRLGDHRGDHPAQLSRGGGGPQCRPHRRLV